MTYLEFRRKIGISTIFSGFLSFGTSLLISNFKIDLPYFHFENFLPKKLDGVSDIIYIDIIKNVLVANSSIFLSYFLPTFFISLIVAFKFNSKEEEIHKRGSKLLNFKDLKKEIFKYIKVNKDNYRLEVGKEQIPIPFTQEVKNTLIVGMVGSGKSQAIYNLIFGNFDKKGKNISKGIVDFREPMIIYERKGEDFLGSLYRREKDLLFDPRDIDCIKWNIFEDMLNENNEIEENMVDFFVSSICPISDSKSAHFEEQGSSVIKALLLAVAGSGKANNKYLIDYIRSYPTPKELREALINNETVRKFGVNNQVIGALTINSEGQLDNQGNSVFATCNKVFKNLSNRAFYFEESNFSVRKFIKSLENEKTDIRLFIVNTSLSEGAYNTYFSLFFTLIFKHILSLKNSNNRRVHLILDELMSLASNKILGKFLITKLIDTLAESRSKGLNTVLAFQALSQLSEIVGENLLKSLFQMCGTKIILQYSEPQGAKLLSQFLGEKEIDRKKFGVNRANNLSGDRVNENEEEKIKKIVLESEFANLEPLTGFIKVGNFAVSKISFNFYQPEYVYTGLIKSKIPYFEDFSEIKNEENKSGFIA
ncbi:MAG: type IV secretion system DNA-binding domain-containing protein [Arcobacter sp.]|uniref:type IV secretion system DNA-binding domain-containing protein n=1 Tax=Arcobacter sp. TaxID=1872629 RepID=UPI003D000EE8